MAHASETFHRRDDAHKWARQAETRVDQGLSPNKSSAARLATFGDLVALHIDDMCAVGKPPRRSKAATLATLKNDLGKERIGHIDRAKLIDYGKMRADSPGPLKFSAWRAKLLLIYWCSRLPRLKDVWVPQYVVQDDCKAGHIFASHRKSSAFCKFLLRSELVGNS